MAIKFKQDTRKGVIISYYASIIENGEPKHIVKEMFVPNKKREDIGDKYEYVENRKRRELLVKDVVDYEQTIYSLDEIFKHIAIPRPEGITNEEFAEMIKDHFRKVCKDI